MRLFLAVFPPADAQMAASRAAASFRQKGDDIAWVHRDQLHYTLRFLGETGAHDVRAAAEAAKEAAKSIAPFGVSLGGFAAFPSARQARVLWIGLLQGSEPMQRLASALEDALARHGFAKAETEFEPHLTIGRLRESADMTQRLIASPMVDVRFQVDSVLLVKSMLGKSGSVYEPMSSAKLLG
jgi:2'-5' RNA ligase